MNPFAKNFAHGSDCFFFSSFYSDLMMYNHRNFVGRNSFNDLTYLNSFLAKTFDLKTLESA